MFEKLRSYMEHGNVDQARCIQIAKEADIATMEFSKSQDMFMFVMAAIHCCGKEEDEFAFYKAAVDEILKQRWKAAKEESFRVVFQMEIMRKHLLDKAEENRKDKSPSTLDFPNLLETISSINVDLCNLLDQKKKALEELDFERFMELDGESLSCHADQIGRIVEALERLHTREEPDVEEPPAIFKKRIISKE